MKVASLGYVRVESPNARQWEAFGPEVLGMALSDDAPPGTVQLTNDDRPGRLTISEGPRNRLSCLGWEVAGEDDFGVAVDELERAGLNVRRADDEQRQAAHVRDLVSFTDPAGFTHEVFYGQLVLPASFRPGRAMSGFVTGGEGFGHAVLIVPDLAKELTFVREVLGFRVSDEIDMGTRVVFLHANARHHTLAMIGLDGLRGMHHLMVQVQSLDDVGMAYDLCLDRGVPISSTLGRHTNDHMFSFYMRTPSGFDLEYGWGALAVDDESWVMTHLTAPSIWGHRPVETTPPGDCLEPV
ncbi:MAG TPA: VOC family protein [Acidimicrobiales bacterium]|nr:VOC family protein [Acidimicrobiales bacterium]